VVPIQNVSIAPVTSASGKALSVDQVKGAFIRAGAGLGWQMRDYNGWIKNLTRGINAQLSAS
jgi:hypothetical protein